MKKSNESIYKTYKSLFGSLKKKYKKSYYARRLENYQNGIKKSWDVINETIVGAKSTIGSFPKIMIIDGQEIFDQGMVANRFNKSFIDIVQTILNDFWMANQVWPVSKPTSNPHG